MVLVQTKTTHPLMRRLESDWVQLVSAQRGALHAGWFRALDRDATAYAALRWLRAFATQIGPPDQFALTLAIKLQALLVAPRPSAALRWLRAFATQIGPLDQFALKVVAHSHSIVPGGLDVTS